MKEHPDGQAHLLTGRGSLLDADVEAIVNPVNTVGVMGKGLALQFKRAYPGNFAAYRAACMRGEVRVGEMLTWPTGLASGPRFIVNFPTKEHWRDASRLPWIEAGLGDLRRVISDLGIRSVAVPALGCGLGGLDWADVRPLIAGSLGGLPGVRVMIHDGGRGKPGVG